MKENFMKHKKKIIIAVVTVLSYFFAPAAITVPILERLIDDDTVEKVHVENIKDAKELLNVQK